MIKWYDISCATLYMKPVVDSRLTEIFITSTAVKNELGLSVHQGQLPGFYGNRRHISMSQQPAIRPISEPVEGIPQPCTLYTSLKISQAVSTLLIFRSKFCIYSYHLQPYCIFVHLIRVFAVVFTKIVNVILREKATWI